MSLRAGGSEVTMTGPKITFFTPTQRIGPYNIVNGLQRKHRIIRLPQNVGRIRYALVPARRTDLVLLFTDNMQDQNMHTYEVVWAEDGWHCGRKLCEQRIPNCQCKSVSDNGSHIAHVYNTYQGIILRVFPTFVQSPVLWGFAPCGEVRMPGIDTSSIALFNPTGTQVAIFVADDDDQEIHVYDCSLKQVKLLSLALGLSSISSLQYTLHWADADTLRWLVVEHTGVLGVYSCSALPHAQPTKISEVVLEGGVYMIKSARVAQLASGTFMAVEYYLPHEEELRPIYLNARATKAAMIAFDPTPRVAHRADSMEELWNMGNNVNIVGPYAYKISGTALEITELPSM